MEIRVLGAFGLIDQGEMDWKVFGLVEEEAKRLNVSGFYWFLHGFFLENRLIAFVTSRKLNRDALQKLKSGLLI